MLKLATCKTECVLSYIHDIYTITYIHYAVSAYLNPKYELIASGMILLALLPLRDEPELGEIS